MGVPVIIVDDDAAVLFLHEVMVRESNFADDIKSFSRAEPALTYLEAYDSECVIFLDINMPGMSGWDFLKRLDDSDLNDDIYVIVVSSSLNSLDRKIAKNYKHVVDFVEKPLNVDVCERLKKQNSLKHLFAGG